MNTNDLLKAFALLSDDDNTEINTETYDLTTKKGYDKFKKAIAELKESGSPLFDLFNIDMDEWLDDVAELGEAIYNKKNSEKQSVVKEAVKQMERKEVDHTEEDEEDEDTKEFKRPSELLSVDQKLQLHKLVQEYVDTVIKPFNKGALTNDQINDAYAGLYEFGAWILNR